MATNGQHTSFEIIAYVDLEPLEWVVPYYGDYKASVSRVGVHFRNPHDPEFGLDADHIVLQPHTELYGERLKKNGHPGARTVQLAYIDPFEDLPKDVQELALQQYRDAVAKAAKL